jgi:DNA processing protein
LDEAAALLSLLRNRKSGWGHLADEVDEAGSALAVYERSAATFVQGDLFAAPSPERVQDPLDAARQAIQVWQSEGINLVTLLDPAYPQQLLTVHQRPPFLFYRGHFESSDATSVAIVGTRKPSQRGVARAEAIAAGLADRGVTVVSGLAVGTGLRKSYPATNRALQDRIGREHLVISQFWPDAPPTKTSFPMRNAVMSGYSAATVVIEAAWKSGARMQARLALEHGRPVFLHESLLDHDWARDYVARGAVVIRSAEDVLDQLATRLAIVDELVWS